MTQVRGRGWAVMLALAGSGAALLGACGDDADSPDPSGSAGVSGMAGMASTNGGGSAGAAAQGSNEAGVAGSSGGGDGGSSPNVGTGGAGEGGAGGAESWEAPVLTPRWLVFNHTDGLYLYDLTQFPSADGLTLLAPYGAVRDSGWSPDGQRLITGGVGGVVVRDMSGDTPGEPQLLADCAGPALDYKRVFEWMGDGKSAVCIRQGGDELVAFDPATAAPSLHTVDDNVIAYSVSPAGNKLAFMNEVGIYVVSIDAGKVGTPEYLEPNYTADLYFRNEFIWSPDGNYLAYARGEGALYDLTNVPLVRHTLTNPTVVNGGVWWAEFSPDSQFLAFRANEDRKSYDAFYLDVSNPSKRVDLSPGLGASAGVPWGGWVSSAPHFAYSVWDDQANTGKAVQLDASDPETAADLPFALGSTTTWLRGSRRVVSGVGDALAVLDLASPDTEPVPLVTPLTFRYQVAATSKVVGYERDSHTVGVVSVDDPTDTSELTVNAGVDSGVPSWQLSPDGGFLVVIDRYLGNRTLKLIRLDGGQTSAPVAPVQKASKFEPAYSFQRTR